MQRSCRPAARETGASPTSKRRASSREARRPTTHGELVGWPPYPYCLLFANRSRMPSAADQRRRRWPLVVLFAGTRLAEAASRLRNSDVQGRRSLVCEERAIVDVWHGQPARPPIRTPASSQPALRLASAQQSDFLQDRLVCIERQASIGEPRLPSSEPGKCRPRSWTSIRALACS